MRHFSAVRKNLIESSDNVTSSSSKNRLARRPACPGVEYRRYALLRSRCSVLLLRSVTERLDVRQTNARVHTQCLPSRRSHSINYLIQLWAVVSRCSLVSSLCLLSRFTFALSTSSRCEEMGRRPFEGKGFRTVCWCRPTDIAAHTCYITVWGHED